ncbi:aldehyde dehydrogenase family protein [Pacificoceanicola onchidii]|uniref:aldehyde dehydrogenase family protein n=1 Tax=Pacificoceanicola onchidii TaxID=2562685 RepID=UPI0010A450BE|nr:aldehyde dehydrogenase family protein [Pacificoceanicola onchidii]
MNQMIQSGFLSQEVSNFVSKTHHLFINNKMVAAKSGETFAVLNPANGEKIADVPHANPEDVDDAVRAARAAFESGPWARMTPVDRGKLVWRLGDLIEKHADELAQLESLDNGKPITAARGVDLNFGVELLRYMGGWSTKILGNSVPVSLEGDWHAYTMREPVGVCAQIVPWNYPLLMAIWKIAPALAAGCTMVLKPAEQTPLSALRLAEIIAEAGIPEGVVNIVTGDGRTGAALVEHPDVDKVAFTGSTDTGKRIMKTGADTVKKVSLELGGKSPAIVFPDAEMDVTIPGLATGIFFNAGQSCTASSRIFAHKSVYDKVVAGLEAEANKAIIGPGLDPSTTLGPITSDEQFQKVCGYIDAGRNDGAEIVFGGKRWGNEGYFVEPTVLANTTNDMSVIREEIFGPVVCVIPFGDDDGHDELVQKANDTDFGLGASVFTRDIGHAHKLARRIKAGTVWINTHLPNDVALPFGGYKQSGYGREMGFEAVELYTQVKTVLAKL